MRYLGVALHSFQDRWAHGYRPWQRGLWMDYPKKNWEAYKEAITDTYEVLWYYRVKRGRRRSWAPGVKDFYFA